MTITQRERSPELAAFDAFLGCWNYNTQMHLWRYVFAGSYVQDKLVVDIASGVGYGTYHLAARGAKMIFGVDLDTRALAYASDFYGSPSIQYVNGNGLRLPFEDGSIDVIVSFETIEHIPAHMQEPFVAEIYRVIRPQGIFLCSSLNHQFSPGHVDHTREFLPDELFGMIRRYFSQVQEYGQYITPDDLAFQIARTSQLKFKMRRKRNLLLSRAVTWYRAGPMRMMLRNYIRKLIGKTNRPRPGRSPVYFTDSLMRSLDSQYAPVPIAEHGTGILFDPIAVSVK